MILLTACGGIGKHHDFNWRFWEREQENANIIDGNQNGNNTDNGNKIEFENISFAEDCWSIVGLVSGEIARGADPADFNYFVGDEKDIPFPTTQNPFQYITVRILGFNHDNLADGSGKAGISIGMIGVLGESHIMNATGTNSGGWNASDMRIQTLPALFEILPSELQAVIKPVVKTSLAGNQSLDIVETHDKLWLLSQEEIIGRFVGTPDISGEGYQYEFWRYAGDHYPMQAPNPLRVKTTWTGMPMLWFLRSSVMFNNSSFSAVSAGGAIDHINASFPRGVSFAFAV